MEKQQIEKILSKIRSIENENVELDQVISEMEVPNRDKILEEILMDIIRSNLLFQSLDISQEILSKNKVTELESVQTVINNLLSNIRKMPNKKVIFLRSFLERFEEISEQDKNVILQSLKDDDYDDIEEKIISLINAFKLKE
jgi:hypothetical protein